MQGNGFVEKFTLMEFPCSCFVYVHMHIFIWMKLTFPDSNFTFYFLFWLGRSFFWTHPLKITFYSSITTHPDWRVAGPFEGLFWYGYNHPHSIPHSCRPIDWEFNQSRKHIGFYNFSFIRLSSVKYGRVQLSSVSVVKWKWGGVGWILFSRVIILFWSFREVGCSLFTYSIERLKGVVGFYFFTDINLCAQHENRNH